MIDATSAFNMGAMENKGLNIFNTSCVLADEEYTTAFVEYFKNSGYEGTGKFYSPLTTDKEE